MEVYYTEKQITYFDRVRYDIISLIPKNSDQKIIEIGAGACDTLVALKEGGLAKSVTGVELFHFPDSNQQNPLIDKLIVGDIEKDDVVLPEDYFDVVICGDVLEHLIDPWLVIEKLSVSLKKGGILIASIPNVREVSVLYKILFKGDFQYSESGMLDKTHLRFFCKKNILKLLSTSKLTVKNVTSTMMTAKKSRRRVINRLTFGLLEEFLVNQYIVVSQKK